MDKIYVLHVSEDGDASLREVSDFQKWTEQEFGGCTPPKFLSEIPRDLMSGRGGWYLVIKGQVVTPKAVQVVTKYEV